MNERLKIVGKKKKDNLTLGVVATSVLIWSFIRIKLF